MRSVNVEYAAAAEAAADFRRARRRADLAEVLAALRGRERPLWRYDDVRRALRAVEAPTARLEDVPLDAIVGSVGRAVDFTRDFLPLSDADRGRWVGVKVAMTGLAGTPPVDLYRIGSAYFVRDGNHRVSVARQLGARFIQAYVTPVHARVALTPDMSPDELIVAAEHVRFLEATGLDELRPRADVRVTTPGAFEELREHIAVHRYFMGLDERRDVGEGEAVAHWYDAVYLPVVERIRATDLLADFPERTEADLYLYLSRHRGRLASELGFDLPSESIAEGVVARATVPPPERQGALLAASRRGGAVWDDVMVLLGDAVAPTPTLRQAIAVAAREGGRVYGLYVGAAAEAARAVLQRACAEVGVAHQFAAVAGPAVPALLARARWVDVVVVPNPTTGPELPGYAQLLRRTPRPVLVVGEGVSRFERALVAFDGGARARAALFVGAYAALRHGAALTVVTVGEQRRAAEGVLEQARSYLAAHALANAEFLIRSGPVADTIVTVAEQRRCDLVLMGSYRYPPWLESVLGGVLERVLHLARTPVLVA
jgi:nucleotide-binding universal stress UspA family protein